MKIQLRNLRKTLSLDNERVALVLLMAAAAAVYLSFTDRYYVGYFNDDAAYILAAKSLLQGRYSALFLPGEPPLIQHPPGFPILLAPFVGLIQPHWSLLRILMIGMTLLSGYVVWKFARLWLSASLSLAAAALFLFNPTTVITSSAVMSDTIFFCFTILTLLHLKYLLEEPTDARAGFSGLILAWTTLMRPQGGVLLAAVLASLLYGKRWRILLITGSVAVGCVAVYLLRNWAASHAVTNYTGYWHILLFQEQNLQVRALSMLTTMLFIFCHVTLGLWTSPHGLFGWFFCGSLFLACLTLLYIGSRRLLMMKRNSEIVTASVIFGVLYFLTLLPWPPEERHFTPLFPLIWIAVLAGMDRVSGMFWKRGLAILLIGGIYLHGNLFLYNETRSKKPIFARRPDASFEWVRSHTPPGTVFVVSKTATFFLYTGRQGIQPVSAESLRAFQQTMMSTQADYLFCQTRKLSDALNENDPLEQMLLGARLSPTLFEQVYQNEEEGTVIYRRRLIVQKTRA